MSTMSMKAKMKGEMIQQWDPERGEMVIKQITLTPRAPVAAPTPVNNGKKKRDDPSETDLISKKINEIPEKVTEIMHKFKELKREVLDNEQYAGYEEGYAAPGEKNCDEIEKLLTKLNNQVKEVGQMYCTRHDAIDITLLNKKEVKQPDKSKLNKNEDGTYKRPRGAPRQNQQWDSERGEWTPQQIKGQKQQIKKEVKQPDKRKLNRNQDGTYKRPRGAPRQNQQWDSDRGEWTPNSRCGPRHELLVSSWL